jgi:hypothetical protein
MWPFSESTRRAKWIGSAGSFPVSKNERPLARAIAHAMRQLHRNMPLGYARSQSRVPSPRSVFCALFPCLGRLVELGLKAKGRLADVCVSASQQLSAFPAGTHLRIHTDPVAPLSSLSRSCGGLFRQFILSPTAAERRVLRPFSCEVGNDRSTPCGPTLDA